MKKKNSRSFGRFLLRFPLKVLTLSLAIAFLPYASTMLSALFSDTYRLAEKTSMTLEHRFRESARLETSVLQDTGVATYTLDALFLGEVARVSVEYTYYASVGLDLTQVQAEAVEGRIDLLLPELEIISFITPTQVDRNDFWYGYGIGEKQQQAMLEEERLNLDARYMQDNDERQRMWEAARTALETTIGTWLKQEGGEKLEIRYILPTLQESEVAPHAVP